MPQDRPSRDNVRNGLLIAGAASLGALLAYRAFRSSPDFKDQVVLITGGSRGLGLALAERFRGLGARLVLLARDTEELRHAKQLLLERVPKGGDIFTFACDVSDWEAVQRVIDNATWQTGRIDVLVNVAGIIQVGPIEAQTHKDFEDAMNVNFWGEVNTTLAVLPQMLQRESGRIINITSIGGKMAVPHLLPYTCSKFAAVGFSLGLRSEVANRGIKVTTVVPGLMRTGSFLNADFKGDQESEYSWFSVSSSLPGLTISAEKAAHQIVDAAAGGSAEVVLGAPAKLAANLSSTFPGITSDILAFVNRALPESRDRSTKKGRESRTAVSESVLTRLGQRAADEFNQRTRAS
jgi:short-subunit dehydrogenase